MADPDFFLFSGPCSIPGVVSMELAAPLPAGGGCWVGIWEFRVWDRGQEHRLSSGIWDCPMGKGRFRP